MRRALLACTAFFATARSPSRQPLMPRRFTRLARCFLLDRGECMTYHTDSARVTGTQGVEVLSIRLKPNIERRLNRLAKETGRTKTFYASKLIEENLEDLEDRYLAEARLEKRGKSYTSAQARRELGLDN